MTGGFWSRPGQVIQCDRPVRTGITPLLVTIPARSWLQWLGGLGIVVLSVVIFLPQSKATLYLFRENWEAVALLTPIKKYPGCFWQDKSSLAGHR